MFFPRNSLCGGERSGLAPYLTSNSRTTGMAKERNSTNPPQRIGCGTTHCGAAAASEQIRGRRDGAGNHVAVPLLGAGGDGLESRVVKTGSSSSSLLFLPPLFLCLFLLLLPLLLLLLPRALGLLGLALSGSELTPPPPPLPPFVSACPGTTPGCPSFFPFGLAVDSSTPAPLPLPVPGPKTAFVDRKQGTHSGDDDDGGGDGGGGDAHGDVNHDKTGNIYENGVDEDHNDDDEYNKV